MSNEEGSRAHPPDANSPAYAGGRGSFKSARPPGSIGTDRTRVHVGRTAGKLRSSDYKGVNLRPLKVEPGTREEVVDSAKNTRMVVERRQDGMYYWLIETLDGKQSCEGVYDPDTSFSGEICVDITSKAALRELEKMVKTTSKPKPKKPGGTPQPQDKREVIFIVKADWLTKISEARWGNWDWKRYLKPTPETLDKRRKKGELFDPDWIYPGDTFEVIDPNSILAKPLRGGR